MATLKRVLIVGTSLPERLEGSYVRAFRKLGVEPTVFDVERPVRWYQKTRVHNRLTARVQPWVLGHALERFYARPMWDAVLVFKGYYLAPSTIRKLRTRAEVPWTVLNPDSPFEQGSGASSPYIRRSIPEYDLYFIWSRALLGRLREAGARQPVYLPFAADELTHYPAPTRDPSLAGTVVLVGTCDPQRAELIRSIADLPVRVYGTGWDRVAGSRLRNKVSPGVWGEDLRRVSTSALACLNVLRPQNTGAHNMRTFEVPAMGGVMLATRSAEQRELFPEGSSSLMFSDPRELREVITGLTRGQFDTESIRRRALEHAAGHTYTQRARRILDAIAAL
jgi:hypothetical protein